VGAGPVRPRPRRLPLGLLRLRQPGHAADHHGPGVAEPGLHHGRVHRRAQGDPAGDLRGGRHRRRRRLAPVPAGDLAADGPGGQRQHHLRGDRLADHLQPDLHPDRRAVRHQHARHPRLQHRLRQHRRPGPGRLDERDLAAAGHHRGAAAGGVPPAPRAEAPGVSTTGYATRQAKPRSTPPSPGFQLRNPRRTWRITTGILVALLFAIPVLYVVMISFESQGHFVRSPLTPPASPTFSNFSAAWSQGDLGPEVLNTILYSVVAAAISVALSLLIAFPIARRLVRASTFIYRTFVIGVCIPLPVIPLFIEAQRLDLYNSRIGYILLHVEPGLPLGVILLTAFVMSVP